MKTVRAVTLALCMAGITFLATAQIAPPPTGKLSWDLFQEAVAGQRTKAAGQQAPVILALLSTAVPVTDGDLDRLRDLGYTVLSAFAQFVLVQAPADLYADVEKGVDRIEFVTNAALPPSPITPPRPSAEGQPVTGSSREITNGTMAIGAHSAWALGYFGQGQKVAVIDSGFDMTNPTLQKMNPTYYLVTPSPVAPGAYTTAIGKVGDISDHGTACAIIVGDVAPQAELYLLSYPPIASLLGWLMALHFAVHGLGATVISTSVEFSTPTCHADGTGPLNKAVDDILEGTDAVLVIASGNWGAGSGSDRWFYRGVFSDGDGDFRHNFTVSADAWDRNTLRFEGKKGTYIQIILEWDDWQGERRAYDLDLYLLDGEFEHVWARSLSQQFGQTTNPVERISGYLPYTGPYSIVVEDRAAKWNGQVSRSIGFHLYLYAANGTFSSVEHHTTCGSVREVATNTGVWVTAVGAVGVEDAMVRPYSSRGPTRSGYRSPALYGPDGVSGTPYGLFFGTSASAPYVAGTIALVYSTDRVRGRDDMISVLRESAVVGAESCGNPVCIVRVPSAVQHILAR